MSSNIKVLNYKMQMVTSWGMLDAYNWLWNYWHNLIFHYLGHQPSEQFRGNHVVLKSQTQNVSQILYIQYRKNKEK